MPPVADDVTGDSLKFGSWLLQLALSLRCLLRYLSVGLCQRLCIFAKYPMFKRFGLNLHLVPQFSILWANILKNSLEPSTILP